MLTRSAPDKSSSTFEQAYCTCTVQALTGVIEQQHDGRVAQVACHDRAGRADCGPRILSIRSTILYEASGFTHHPVDEVCLLRNDAANYTHLCYWQRSSQIPRCTVESSQSFTFAQAQRSQVVTACAWPRICLRMTLLLQIAPAAATMELQLLLGLQPTGCPKSAHVPLERGLHFQSWMRRTRLVKCFVSSINLDLRPISHSVADVPMFLQTNFCMSFQRAIDVRCRVMSPVQTIRHDAGCNHTRFVPNTTATALLPYTQTTVVLARASLRLVNESTNIASPQLPPIPIQGRLLVARERPCDA
ncbi:hypothetical protein J3F83DRAFT_30298 [Trichoderma novae-zelandiae]